MCSSDLSADSIWLVIDKRGTLVRIDPQTNKIRQKLRVPPGSYNPLYSDGQIFVTHADGAEATVLDANSGATLATVPTGPSPRFLTAGAGAVWTLNQGDGSVSRIDPATNKVSATIEVGVPGEGGDIAVGEGYVWVTAIGKPLSKIDPANNRVVAQYVGKGGEALRVGLGSLWLSNHEFHEVWRIDPKGL